MAVIDKDAFLLVKLWLLLERFSLLFVHVLAKKNNSNNYDYLPNLLGYASFWDVDVLLKYFSLKYL